MILTSDYDNGNIFWRTFNTNDAVLAFGLAEGVLRRGQSATFNHPTDGSFKMEIKKDGLFGPILIAASLIIPNALDLTFANQFHLNFLFDSSITAAERARLLDRHLAGFNSFGGCGNLTDREKGDLLATYFRGVTHHPYTGTASINAQANLGGSELWIAPVWYTLSDDEASQTLIHELMHCAGYSHPLRRDPDPALGQNCSAPDPAAFDCPYDNGVYYGTAPLRAELCIAGQQSRLAQGRFSNCMIDKTGKATLENR